MESREGVFLFAAVSSGSMSGRMKINLQSGIALERRAKPGAFGVELAVIAFQALRGAKRLQRLVLEDRFLEMAIPRSASRWGDHDFPPMTHATISVAERPFAFEMQGWWRSRGPPKKLDWADISSGNSVTVFARRPHSSRASLSPRAENRKR